MTEPATIREATIGDADQLWPLVRSFAQPFAPEHEAFVRLLPQLVGRDDTLLAVADLGGTAVGYVLASVHLALLANGPVAWVEEVLVAPDRRGEGLGAQLMAAAESWARELGAAYVALASRRAGDFYLALGYEDSAVFFKRTLRGSSPHLG